MTGHVMLTMTGHLMRKQLLIGVLARRSDDVYQHPKLTQPAGTRVAVGGTGTSKSDVIRLTSWQGVRACRLLLSMKKGKRVS